MTVTAADIEAMKNLMLDDNGVVPVTSSAIANTTFADDSQQGIAVMHDLLQGFHEILDDPQVRFHVTKTMYDFVDQAIDEPKIREAVMTLPTKTGFRYGSYELVEEKISPNRSEFKIVSNGMIVAENMTLRESALGILRELNNGKPMNSNNIVMLLNEEQKFSSAIADSTRYKRKQKLALTESNWTAADVNEARYDRAKQNAIDAKNRAAEILRTIRSK